MVQGRGVGRGTEISEMHRSRAPQAAVIGFLRRVKEAERSRSVSWQGLLQGLEEYMKFGGKDPELSSGCAVLEMPSRDPIGGADG